MATGQPIGDLLDLDHEMLLTLAEVHATEWTRPEHLLAVAVDMLGIVGHNALIAPYVDPKKLKKAKPPAPLERPGQRRKRRRATAEETAGFFTSALNERG